MSEHNQIVSIWIYSYTNLYWNHIEYVEFLNLGFWANWDIIFANSTKSQVAYLSYIYTKPAQPIDKKLENSVKLCDSVLKVCLKTNLGAPGWLSRLSI